MIINNVRADKYYNEGVLSIREGNYSRAKKYFKVALFYDYSKHLIQYQMGLINLYSLSLKDATRYFLDYLSLVEEAEDMVYFYLGYSYYLLNNKKEAKHWFERGFSEARDIVVRYKSLFYLNCLDVYSSRDIEGFLNKDDFTSNDNRVNGIIFLLRGKYDSAVNLFLSSLNNLGSFSNSRIEVYRELSDCFTFGGNYNAFINFFYERFGSIKNLNDKTILFNLAKSFYLSSAFSKAKDILLILLKALRYHSGLYFNLANSYYNLGRYNLSIKYYLKTVNLDNSFYKAYYNLGVLYQGEGLLKRSISYYNKALALNSSLFGAYYNLGILYYQSNDYASALNNVSLSLGIEPYNEAALNNFNVMSKINQIVINGDRDGRLLKLINIFLFALTVVIILLFFYLR